MGEGDSGFVAVKIKLHLIAAVRRPPATRGWYYTLARKEAIFACFCIAIVIKGLQGWENQIFFAWARSSGYIVKGCFWKVSFGFFHGYTRINADEEPASTGACCLYLKVAQNLPLACTHYLHLYIGALASARTSARTRQIGAKGERRLLQGARWFRVRRCGLRRYLRCAASAGYRGMKLIL
ncbi:MAG TPA: hypothetical protein DCQ12_07330 [Candidatus Cloacimonas sp.]|nr:hypothetical protein [Candidatus Cloacimonas sp.]